MFNNKEARENVVNKLRNYVEVHGDEFGEQAELRVVNALDDKVLIVIQGLCFMEVVVLIDIDPLIGKSRDEIRYSVNSQIIPELRAVNPVELFNELWTESLDIPATEYMEGLIDDMKYFEIKAAVLDASNRIYEDSLNYV